MRIRSTKPEFWKSDDIAALKDWGDRLLFMGLWNYADDNGIGRRNLKLIQSELFPLEDDPVATLIRITEGMERLEMAHLVVPFAYQGVDYFCVTNWHKHQRISGEKRTKLPLPTWDGATWDPRFDTAYENYLPISGNREQGSGSREQVNVPAGPSADCDPDQLFETWWNWYPRKVAKPRARIAFAKALKKIDYQSLLEATKQFATDPNLPTGEDTQFIKHPPTWLNQESWNDGPLPSRYKTSPIKKTATQRAEEYMTGHINHNPYPPLSQASFEHYPSQHSLEVAVTQKHPTPLTPLPWIAA